jgi:hypothetical protein
MAGAGNKLFTSGSVLTASDVNTYLMDQTIMRFTSTTTRDAAFGGAGEPTLAEGMFAYTSDTNTLWSYNGSSWVAVLGSDIGSISTSNRNKAINGMFNIWQRGTSFTVGAAFPYTADRWQVIRGGVVAGMTVTRQATGDTTNLPFIQYAARVQRDSGNTSTGFLEIAQSLESNDSIPLAGKSITFSFYARKGANYSAAGDGLTFQLRSGTGTDQNIVTTGYTGSVAVIDSTATLTTTWQRFQATGTVAGTATEIGFYFACTPVGTAGANDYYEVTGVQVESGSVATPFESEDIGTTLAKCQRYYYVLPRTADSYSDILSGGTVDQTAYARYGVYRPVMRTESYTLSSSAANLFANLNASGNQAGTTISFTNGMINLYSASLSTGQSTALRANNSATAFIALSTEL